MPIAVDLPAFTGEISALGSTPPLVVQATAAIARRGWAATSIWYITHPGDGIQQKLHELSKAGVRVAENHRTRLNR